MNVSDHDISKVRLLKHIRRSGTSSRIEIANATGLAKATVTELTAALVRQGILAEATSVPSGRGRPRIGLRIVEDAAYAIGFFPLGKGQVSLDVIDLNGRRIFSEQQELGALQVDSLAVRAADLIEQAIIHSGVRRDRLRHAGIVLPGQVDRLGGIVHWMPQSDPHDPVAIGPLIEGRLGIPVTVDNRASVFARAEHWFGDEEFADDFTCIALMESGMGAARYRHGMLQTGVNGLNSEFAHVKVAFEGGRPCLCGATGCVGAYASAGGIVAQFRREGGDEAAAFPEIAGRARAGEERAAALFATAGRALGAAVASHLNEVDPGKVLILSGAADFPDLLAPEFHAALQAHALPAVLHRTQVAFRELDQQDYWKGAASLALEQLYQHSAAS